MHFINKGNLSTGNPKEVLAREGIRVPAEVDVNVVENTDKLMYVILPVQPATRELTEEELEMIAGGSGQPPVRMSYHY
jgi:hypothetical protein